MEDLAGIIPVIIIAVISIISKANAKNKKAQEQQRPQPGYTAPKPATANPYTPPQARPTPPPAPAARPAAAPPVAQPTVHTHLDPDCEVHDAPTSGSLNVRSTEGKDPCHEDQLPPQRPAVQAPAAEKPSLTLDWSGDAMVRAFVMQEVLTRPCDRRR